MNTPERPLVTFLMPCYNSAAFMERGIDSLVAAITKTDCFCEIILVNDGSSDDTSVIAHRYTETYDFIMAVDQENANWGGVVNRGLSMTRGTYLKVIDSDDSFDEDALQRVLETLALAMRTGSPPDLLITNYVYDRKTDNTQHTIHYRKLFPTDRIFAWSEVGRPGIGQVLMLHATWFKTEVLRESKLELPTGVSYMDSLFILHPLPYVKTLLYLDVDAYKYLIGREGQSVEIDVVKRRIDQQLLATKLAIDDADYTKLYADEPKRARLMTGYVECMMSVSTIYLFMINTPEALTKNNDLWAYLKEKNPTLYRYVRRGWAGWANRKTALLRLGARGTYMLAKRIFKFA